MAKKRLGIFCFYDKEGIADQYIEYLLKEIKTIVCELVVVVNGTVSLEGEVLFQLYAEKIYIRNNEGLDGGAYADVIVNVIGERGLQGYDEIILCNDTFFGPLIPFYDIFAQMEYKNYDCWGLGEIKSGFLSYIHSYFLVFRRKVIQEGAVYQFFYSLSKKTIEDFYEAVALFEIALCYYLKKSGYAIGAYCYTDRYNTYRNPLMQLKRYRFPIVKRKCFSGQYLTPEKQGELLYYMRNQYDYDIEMIQQCVERIYGYRITEIRIDRFDELAADHEIMHSEEEFLDFVNNNEKLYIYGTGYYAKVIYTLYKEHLDKVEGFVVTDRAEESELYGIPVLTYEECDKNIPLILTLNKANTEEVKPLLSDGQRFLELWKAD